MFLLLFNMAILLMLIYSSYAAFSICFKKKYKIDDGSNNVHLNYIWPPVKVIVEDEHLLENARAQDYPGSFHIYFLVDYMKKEQNITGCILPIQKGKEQISAIDVAIEFPGEYFLIANDVIPKNFLRENILYFRDNNVGKVESRLSYGDPSRKGYIWRKKVLMEAAQKAKNHKDLDFHAQLAGYSFIYASVCYSSIGMKERIQAHIKRWQRLVNIFKDRHIPFYLKIEILLNNTQTSVFYGLSVYITYFIIKYKTMNLEYLFVLCATYVLYLVLYNISNK